MRQFDTARDSPEVIHAALTARDTARDAQVEATVRAILEDVRAHGDQAVLDHTRRLDWPGATAKGLEVPADDVAAAGEATAHETDLLLTAAGNIREFHEAEWGRQQSWDHDAPGGLPGQSPLVSLAQLVQPVHRVGVYVPGGKAAYPSTVLMAGIPASVAGVDEVIVCTPPGADGAVHPLLLAAAEVAGIDRVFRIGGAQAVAAMAYGTETVPPCDVIVGPGSAYVNAAKRLVYGDVGIDMLAGPSEVAIVADERANPAFVAADLLAQIEHGPDNKGVLFCHDSAMLELCKSELSEQRAALARQEILAITANNIIFVKTDSLEESLALSNVLAPEHLELMVREPLAALPLVRNAGAVLLGDYTSAAVGDYWAGPSHTLPTAGAARFSSPLSVSTFLKRTSVIYYSQPAASEAAEDVARFAEAEGFDGHARAARLRGGGDVPSTLSGKEVGS